MKGENHRQSGKTGHKGFTLIEILIALVLIAISITVLVQLFSTNLRNIGKSQNYVPAVVAAEAKMTEIMATDLLEENTTTYKTDDGYTMDVSISEAMKDRFLNLPVKLMEISLTMRWQMDQKEKTFVLKSYKTVKRTNIPEEPGKKDEKKEEEQSSEKQ